MEEKTIDLRFDPEAYVTKTVEVDGETVVYRAYENIIYVQKPVDPVFQSLHIYVPESAVGKKDVPIFFRNYVGGYMSTPPITPDPGQEPAFLGVGLRYALKKGYVAVSPGARGREDVTDGVFTGKAPADIVDLKAAIRYLRYNADVIPGNMNLIISDGSSAGGAMSALLGTTGNNKAYEPYLRRIGAAEERDDIFAAVCFCPIIDLEHANSAYEWMFGSVTDFSMMKPRVVDNSLVFDPVEIHFDGEKAALSSRFAQEFAKYINTLALRHPLTGEVLDLQPGADEGGWFDYLLEKLGESASGYLAELDDKARREYLVQCPWLRYDAQTGKAVIDPENFRDYVAYVSRGKDCPSFDGFACEITENSLFGTETIPGNHFDDALEAVSGDTGAYIVPDSIRAQIALMNPMVQLKQPESTIAPCFYIRWGSRDSNHGFSAPMNLALALENTGKCREVDFAFAWEYDHDGDYRLEELFGWIDKCVQTSKTR